MEATKNTNKMLNNTSIKETFIKTDSLIMAKQLIPKS
jgi:hypothetical protein